MLNKSISLPDSFLLLLCCPIPKGTKTKGNSISQWSMYNPKQSPGTGSESKAELALARSHGEGSWPGHSHLPHTAPAHQPIGARRGCSEQPWGPRGMWVPSRSVLLLGQPWCWSQTWPCATLGHSQPPHPSHSPCEALGSNIRELQGKKTKEHIMSQFFSFTFK